VISGIFLQEQAPEAAIILAKGIEISLTIIVMVAVHL
jgi:hypothetical protein